MMTEVLLFHHALGRTRGFLAFADELRRAGHTVHSPDLFDGKTFSAIDAGVVYANQIGFDNIIERGVAAASELPEDLVYAGMSLGLLPAQKLAQTRAGARGALLLYGAVPPSALGSSWPEGLPVQIHVTEGDEDAETARELARQITSAELFIYPGDHHLFGEEGFSQFHAESAALLRRRALDFLGVV